MSTPSTVGNHLILTNYEIKNLSNWELIRRIADIPEDVEPTRDALAAAVEKIHFYTDPGIIGVAALRDYRNLLNDPEKSTESIVKNYASNLRDYLTQKLPFTQRSINTGDNRLVLLFSDGLDADEKERIEEFNQFAVKTYCKKVLNVEESELENISELTRDTLNAVTDKNSYEMFLQKGITLDDFNEFKPDPQADAEEKMKKGIGLLSKLTGVKLSENCTYDQCKAALDKLIINDKSAYDFFSLSDEPKDMTTIQNKVIPDLTNAVESMFKGTDTKGYAQNKTFIFIKRDNGEAVPIKLSTEELSAELAENLSSAREAKLDKDGITDNRLMTQSEVRKIIMSDSLGELFKAPDNTGINYGGDNDSPDTAQEQPDTAQQEITDPDAAYIDNIQNLPNSQLLNDFYSLYMKEASDSKIPFSPEILLNIPDENGMTGESQEEENSREAIENHVLNSPNGYKLKTIKEEIERRVTFSVNSQYGSIGRRIESLLNQNLENYNNRQKEINTGYYETLKPNAEKYNQAADTYANMLNNNVIEIGRENLKDLSKNIPNLELSFDDISDNVTFLNAIKRNGPNVDIDNIYMDIDGEKKSLREVTGIKGELTDQNIKIISHSANINSNITKVREAFVKMAHPDEWETAPNGTKKIPFVGIKTGAGYLPVQMTYGEELEAKPEVKTFPDWRKRISRQSTIDANEAAVAEYKKSVHDKEKREKENKSLYDLNNALRINARAASGKELDSDDKYFIDRNHINVPNPLVQNTSLSVLQGGNTNTSGLTQAVIERDNSLHGPQNDNGIGRSHS